MLPPAALEALPVTPEPLPDAVGLPLAALLETPESLPVTPSPLPVALADLVVLPERVTAWELLTLSRISRALAALVWPGLKLSLAGMSALRTEKERSGCETP